MADPAPNPQLLSALGHMVRGLSALFWGLPITLVVCVQTAHGDWLRQLGVLPPLLTTGLLLYGLHLLGHFQRQERVWRHALDRAQIFGMVNVGLSPFLFWWNQLQGHPFYSAMIAVLMLSGLLFLLMLNPVLKRLSSMLPDETLRAESRFFTRLNQYLLGVDVVLLVGYLLETKVGRYLDLPVRLFPAFGTGYPWFLLLLVLVPVAMTMALVWKTKEVILSSVFGPAE